MPLIHAIPAASTVPGTPRASASVDYDGTSNKNLQLQPICATWATASPAITVRVQAQQSFDGEVSWEDFAELNTSPPTLTRAGGIPHIVCQVTDDRGVRRARVVLSVTGGSLVCGVDITTV